MPAYMLTEDACCLFSGFSGAAMAAAERERTARVLNCMFADLKFRKLMKSVEY